EAERAIRAINRQIEGDFAPYWGMSATLRLEGRSITRPNARHLESTAADMRGDAVLYLWAHSLAGALGYHASNHRGIPYGLVAVDKTADDDWRATLSHEALELLADPELNLTAQGPHPDRKKKREVFHWFEMCDAVQAEVYEIDGVMVSNF